MNKIKKETRVRLSLGGYLDNKAQRHQGEYTDDSSPTAHPPKRPPLMKMTRLKWGTSVRFSPEGVVDDDVKFDDLADAKVTLSPQIKQTKSQAIPVFFMIGCQRSGSNWLRTFLAEREDLFAPHPPHIMRDIVPILDKFGELENQKNLKILIDHVCAFVERNQVTWLDLHDRPVKFNRTMVLMDVLLSLECFLFNEKHSAMRDGKPSSVKIVDKRYYLLAIFDVIMNTVAKMNGKTLWLCKSMGMSQYHDLLLKFYGKERLRYIYLVRDPRDVCLSFFKTPVGDCHPYAIATKWAKLQGYAARILEETPDLIHEICYESLLTSDDAKAKVLAFVGARNVSRAMRRGSIVAIKEGTDGAKQGREAKVAQGLSYQFKNLTRGKSFVKGQFKKWAREMKEEDMWIVESVCFETMIDLGYAPHLVKTEELRVQFSEETLAEYNAENKRLIEKMYDDLAITDPEDLKRRQVQAAVLSVPTSYHYDEEFVNSPHFDVTNDDDLDQMDTMATLPKFSDDGFDFSSWPLGAEQVGFMQTEQVGERFCIEPTKTTKISETVSVIFCAASQAGYYPDKKEKPNQDAFVVTTVANPYNACEKGTLIGVFDGHGAAGTECAQYAKDSVLSHFVDGLIDDKETSFLDLATHALSSSFRRTSIELEEHDMIDASKSGTTATCLFLTADCIHVGSVGDSRCILIQHRNDELIVDALTQDHSPDREEEAERIKLAGGIVMSPEQYDVQDETLPSLEPKRVWSKEGKWPGCAFSRSLGDKVGKGLGVISDPECSTRPIPSCNTVFVVGSDGVFDFISDQEIASIVLAKKDPSEACRILVGKAWHRWSESEERVDDITVIVGYIEHSEGSNH